jgi:hypothetical protein
MGLIAPGGRQGGLASQQSRVVLRETAAGEVVSRPSRYRTAAGPDRRRLALVRRKEIHEQFMRDHPDWVQAEIIE